jgi:hypothetical protein
VNPGLILLLKSGVLPVERALLWPNYAMPSIIWNAQHCAIGIFWCECCGWRWEAPITTAQNMVGLPNKLPKLVNLVSPEQPVDNTKAIIRHTLEKRIVFCLLWLSIYLAKLLFQSNLRDNWNIYLFDLVLHGDPSPRPNLGMIKSAPRVVLSHRVSHEI